MTSLAYTSGTTANLVAGGTANMVDITGPLSDFQTFINGAHLDSTTNLAASVFAPYLTIAETSGQAQTLGSSGTFYFSGGACIASGSGWNNNVDLISFDPSDYTRGGRTLKLRLEVISYVGGTPGTNTFTWGLYPVTTAGIADTLTLTLGSVTAGSTVARVNPVDATIYRDVGSDFSAPVAGTYILGFTTTAAVSSTTPVASTIRLQARWI